MPGWWKQWFVPYTRSWHPFTYIHTLHTYITYIHTLITYIYIYIYIYIFQTAGPQPQKGKLSEFPAFGVCGLASCEVDCRDFSSRSFNYPQKLSELSVDSRTFRLRVPPVPEAGVCCLATRISYIKSNTRHTRLVYVHVKLQITYSLTISADPGRRKGERARE